MTTRRKLLYVGTVAGVMAATFVFVRLRGERVVAPQARITSATATSANAAVASAPAAVFTPAAGTSDVSFTAGFSPAAKPSALSSSAAPLPDVTSLAAAFGAVKAPSQAQPAKVPTNLLAQRRFISPNEAWEEGPGTNYVRMEGGALLNEDTVRTAREVTSHSTGTPEWSNPKAFQKDVFTFARIVFKSTVGYGQGLNHGRNLGWWVDFPDADLNFSYRLQQLTSTRVDPDGRTLKLSDPDLFTYPFIYMEHAGYMRLRDPEVEAMRKYLTNGGVMLVGDFWSQLEWDNFEQQVQRVLPGRKWVDVPIEHPIYHSVFDMKGPMQMLQVPTMQFWNRNYNPRNPDPSEPLQTTFRGIGSETMHARAWMDDKDRIMIFVIHNSDYSDGWEREGEHDDYFHTYSEKVSYPLGINIMFYLMTH